MKSNKSSQIANSKDLKDDLMYIYQVRLATVVGGRGRGETVLYHDKVVT
jgi:hypothetical protein